MTRKATLPKLTRREIEADQAHSRWAEPLPPKAEKLLSKVGVTDPAALDQIRDALNTHRLVEGWRDARLSQAERRDQAIAAAQVIADLRARMRVLDPSTLALIETLTLKTGACDGASFGQLWKHQAEPALITTEALLNAVARGMPKPRAGRKPARKDFFRAVLEQIQQHAPNLDAPRARELAAQVATACGVAVADDERTLRRKAGQK